MLPAELERALAVAPAAREPFLGRLAAMERDGQLLTNRKGELCVVAKLDLVVGRVQGHPDGFGFLVPEEGGDDYFLNAREMHKVLHGDRAVVRMSGVDRRGRPEGEIVEVLTRANVEVVGRLHEERGTYFIVAENRRINQDFLVPPGGTGNATVGQIVVAEILEQPAHNREPVARVKEVLGSATDPGIEIEIALRKHALPFEFSKEAVRQAKRLPTEVRPADRKDRVDLTALPLVTIDGENAKDFDDAVYCERKGRNFRLIVAIADVAHYVPPGSPLDRDAFERGNSCYFPDRVVPMLPEALSNGLCSLRPDEDRACLAADLWIDAQGRLVRHRFRRGLMRSSARLTYEQVQAARDGQPDELTGPLLEPVIAPLYGAYQVLLAAREKRGTLELDLPERKVQLGEDGRVASIGIRPRLDSHKLIEEFMIAANVAAAETLSDKSLPALYRVHDQPDRARVESLKEFLEPLGYTLSLGQVMRPRVFGQILARAVGRPEEPMVNEMVLRSQDRWNEIVRGYAAAE